MSPELEMLDQLQGGDLPLSVVRGLFGDDDRFVRAAVAMLDMEEIRLLEAEGTELPRWRWREVLTSPAAPEAVRGRFAITEARARRIG